MMENLTHIDTTPNCLCGWWRFRYFIYDSTRWKLGNKFLLSFARKFAKDHKWSVMTGGYPEALRHSPTLAENDCRWFTLFRHPISRLVSAYFYCRKCPGDVACASEVLNARNVDLITFAEHWGSFGVRISILNSSNFVNVEVRWRRHDFIYGVSGMLIGVVFILRYSGKPGGVNILGGVRGRVGYFPIPPLDLAGEELSSFCSVWTYTQPHPCTAHENPLQVRQFALSLVDSDEVMAYARSPEGRAKLPQVPDVDKVSGWYLLKMYLDDKASAVGVDIPDIAMYDMLEPIQEMLRSDYAAVGILEEFNTTLSLFDAALDMPGVNWQSSFFEKGRVNVDHMFKAQEAAALEQAWTDPKVQKFIWLDLLLYSQAVAIFHDQVRSFGLD